MTRQLAPQLGLDEARQMKIRKALVERLEQEAEVDKMYAGDNTVHASKIQEIRNGYDVRLQELLTPAQLQRYQQLSANNSDRTASASQRP
ncbi:hypothetical protein [Hymenobacter koreensis]|uniref:Uncharacterized protein n=1 Tax=Hymenobacter koreensis TaxID=1084523 RepID=A0ABP8IVW1_9BACT